jgi:hypothetical protein
MLLYQGFFLATIAHFLAVDPEKWNTLSFCKPQAVLAFVHTFFLLCFLVSIFLAVLDRYILVMMLMD